MEGRLEEEADLDEFDRWIGGRALVDSILRVEVKVETSF
jgi:hypothetical protein